MARPKVTQAKPEPEPDQVRIVFERLESGGLFPTLTVHPLRLGRYEGSGGEARRAADIFATLFV